MLFAQASGDGVSHIQAGDGPAALPHSQEECAAAAAEIEQSRRALARQPALHRIGLGGMLPEAMAVIVVRIESVHARRIGARIRVAQAAASACHDQKAQAGLEGVIRFEQWREAGAAAARAGAFFPGNGASIGAGLFGETHERNIQRMRRWGQVHVAGSAESTTILSAPALTTRLPSGERLRALTPAL